jgi:aldehyde dehydrogenase (NAD(P)+)
MATMTPVQPTTHTVLDSAIADLVAHKDKWLEVTIPQRLAYIAQLRELTEKHAERWGQLGIKGKGLDPNSNLAGEEYISGPWPVLHTLNGLEASLTAIANGGIRQDKSLRTRPDGQLVAQTYPLDLLDWILFSNIRTEVWMEKGVTAQNLPQHTGMMYRQKPAQGAVSLVLGAGNISSIPPMDMLYKLFAEGQVVIVKMNPVNEYIGAVLEDVFAPLIRDGYVRIAYGGAEVGQYLTQHPQIDNIHITGSAKTHDIIVYGGGAEGEARKARNEPILQKPITSELGGVTPIIVIPGDWSPADIRYQAEAIATMRMHNAGCNCIAGQVLILPEGWQHTDALLNAIRDVMRSVKRKAYYPNADKRQQQQVSAHPEDAELLGGVDVPNTLITNLDPNNPNEICFLEEAFGIVLGVTHLPAPSPLAFLQNAVAFANDKLMGTLSANIVAHPRQIKELGAHLEQAVADLRYGGIGINCWAGALYLISQNPWGAYPGHTLQDIQSGIGVVHNTFFYEKTQKAVIYGKFYAYPRNLLHGEWHFAPKPSWFVTNKQELQIGIKAVAFEAKRGWLRLPTLIWSALRG